MLEEKLASLLSGLRAVPGDPGRHRKATYLLKRMVETDAARFSDYFSVYQPQACEILGILFQSDAIKHQYSSPLVSGQLRLKYQLDDVSDFQACGSVLKDLARDDLFLALLEKTYNADLQMETFLSRLRRFLLFEFESHRCLPANLLRLAVAMAQQCFNNEYIFDESPQERTTVDRLAHRAGKPGETEFMVLGMYLPLHQQDFALRIDEADRVAFSAAAQSAMVRMINEPLAERRIMDEIPSFAPIENPVSREVRCHYEENPFPRWLNLGGSYHDVENGLREVQPGFGWPPLAAGQKRQILVAGCGTGQQPLGVAIGNPDAMVVAVDLSRASLAYAQRMAQRYRVKNVRFLHGDILNLSALGQSFDHVECIGVLHCFENPVVGWRAIEQVVKPGGTFHVGVYSEVARLQIDWVRRKLDTLEIEATPSGMRKARQEIINGEQYKAVRKLLLERDFFSLSMFRDLLLHDHEHRYVLAEIEAILGELDLKFLGFQLAPALAGQYRARFPDDRRMNSLENWKAFEVHYAGSLQMFRFWLQKPLNR